MIIYILPINKPLLDLTKQQNLNYDEIMKERLGQLYKKYKFISYINLY